MLRQNAEKNKPLLVEPTPTTVFQPAFTANHLRLILEYIVRTHKHRHKYYELYITDNKKGKNLTKTCTNVPSTNNTLRHERNSFQIKLSHSILVRKKREEKTDDKERQKYKAKQTLKTEKKEPCCWRTDWQNEALFTLRYIYFKEPGQSAAGYYGRKIRVSFVSYHVVLTALTVSGLALSIYAVNRLGATDGSPLKPHPVDPNTNYRMWSLVGMPNVGLMVLSPSGSNFFCNGSFNGGGSKFPLLNWFFPFLRGYLEVIISLYRFTVCNFPLPTSFTSLALC